MMAEVKTAMAAIPELTGFNLVINRKTKIKRSIGMFRTHSMYTTEILPRIGCWEYRAMPRMVPKMKLSKMAVTAM